MSREIPTSSARIPDRTGSLPRGESLGSAAPHGISILPGVSLADGEIPTGIGETARLAPIKSPDDLIKGASKRIDLEGGKAVTDYLLSELDTPRVLRNVHNYGLDSAIETADALDVRAAAKARLLGESEKIAEVIESMDGVLLEGSAFYPAAVEKLENLTGILEAQQEGIDDEKNTVLYKRVADNVTILYKAKADVEDLPVRIAGFAEAIGVTHAEADLPQQEVSMPQFEAPDVEEKPAGRYGRLPVEEITPEYLGAISKEAGITTTSVNKLLVSGVAPGDIEDLIALRHPYGDTYRDQQTPRITLKHLSEMYLLADKSVTVVDDIIGMAKDQIRSANQNQQAKAINPVIKEVLKQLTAITDKGYSLEFAMDNLNTRYRSAEDEEKIDPLEDTT